jgi:hypothetical protein
LDFRLAMMFSSLCIIFAKQGENDTQDKVDAAAG